MQLMQTPVHVDLGPRVGAGCEDWVLCCTHVPRPLCELLLYFAPQNTQPPHPMEWCTRDPCFELKVDLPFPCPSPYIWPRLSGFVATCSRPFEFGLRYLCGRVSVACDDNQIKAIASANGSWCSAFGANDKGFVCR